MAQAIPLSVTKIRKTFGTFTAVKDMSFTVKPGEVVGIIGPNGAGKSTTIKMILGLLEPDSGTISLFGSTADDVAVRRRIGYMPETPSFYSKLTGRELLVYVGELFQLPRPIILERTDELLALVGLKDAADRQVGGYSKGMTQRICLAQALMNEPELIFLDEPMDGLDPIGRIRMREILLAIKKRGAAIVFNSHVLSDVELMSDRVAVMDKGELKAFDTVKKLIPKGKTLEDVFVSLVEVNDEA
ncbi:MAG TPA: ABC transporter ATP-binding protein [Verrucomicrobiae bacterium]|nr:ABC transporter ATP-binding protein [Verrucomicrobiae bacterium]